MASFPPGSVDLVVTSPPYDGLRTYEGYTFDFPKIAEELWRVVTEGGIVVWIVGDATVNGSETGTSFRQVLKFMDVGFRLHDTMIWNKGGFTAVGALKTRYGPVFEYMFVLAKGKPKVFNPIKDRKNKKAGTMLRGTIRLPDGSMRPISNPDYVIPEYGQRFNVWDMPPVKSNRADDHPAPFPEALANDHIVSWSNPGDIILDPFAGSGTTLLAALTNGRQAIGIETSEKYCGMIRERLARRGFLPGGSIVAVEG
jgi:site-specific DNA-methyltransferase (adenine-specific)